MKLLYAEDEPAMAEAVADILIYHHYHVETVSNGEDALQYALTGEYDGLILDIMLPGLDGLEVLKELRRRKKGTPVLLLSAKGELEDRILGLDLGADDYLAKPFAMPELLARIRAMLRRREEYTPDDLYLGGLVLNRKSYTLSSEKNSFALSRLEFQLMELFMLHPGLFFSSEKLLERIWGYDTEAELGTVWVYISYLRKKLAALDGGVALCSKRSIGYALEKCP